MILLHSYKAWELKKMFDILKLGTATDSLMIWSRLFQTEDVSKLHLLKNITIIVYFIWTLQFSTEWFTCLWRTHWLQRLLDTEEIFLQNMNRQRSVCLRQVNNVVFNGGFTEQIKSTWESCERDVTGSDWSRSELRTEESTLDTGSVQSLFHRSERILAF